MIENITYEDVKKLERQFIKINSNDKVGHKIIYGNKKSKILISCPHSVCQLRNDNLKQRELYVGAISLLIQKYTGCHLIIKTSCLDDDANYDSESKYKEELTKFVEDNKIKFVFDLHGLKDVNTDVILGTCHGASINYDQKVIRKIYSCFLDNGINSILCDRKLCATGNTITSYVSNNTSSLAMQIEIGKDYRDPKFSIMKFESMLKALSSIVMAFSKYKIDNKDQNIMMTHFKRYDKILLFKTKTIKYNDIPDDYIGMEIEIGMNYNRNEYSFIRKHLLNLKELVGNEGEFYRDYTIVTDYPIEIALIPLSSEALTKKYHDIKELIYCSEGHLYCEKKYKCGIHLNINKPEKLEKVHKNLLNYIASHPEYFVYNKFKKLKFITDYEEYMDYQTRIIGKYTYINYSKPELIEIRNINPEITPYQLEKLCNDLVKIIHGTRYRTTSNEINFVRIFDKVLTKLKSDDVKYIIKNDKLVIEDISTKPRIKKG